MKPEEIEKNRYRGVKIGLVGFTVGLIGFCVECYMGISIAYISFLIGFIIMVAGAYIHYKHWFKELNADPKELYKAAKQPWENDH